MAIADRDLKAALSNAREDEDIIAACVSVEWRRDHPGEDYLDNDLPTPADLVRLWCDTRPEIGGQMAEALALTENLTDDGRVAGLATGTEDGQMVLVTDTTARPTDTPRCVEIRAQQYRHMAPHPDQVRPVPAHGDLHFLFRSPPPVERIISLLLTAVHERRETLPEPRPPHPLVPLIRAWWERPVEVEPERRKDRRILPSVRIIETRPERQTGVLFGGLGLNKEAPKQGTLPFFETPEAKRVPLLNLVDSNRVPVMARGRGAPLELRLFVRSALTVAVEDRRFPVVRVAVTADELRLALRPRGANQTRYWGPLKAALETVDRRWMMLPDGSLWRMFALRHLPAVRLNGTPRADDVIRFDLALPEGAAAGPSIDLPAFDALSFQSAPRWRAAIAAHSLNWDPGMTRKPVPGAPGRWGWARDLSAYPVLTAEDRCRLAFGEHDAKHRTRTQIDAAWRGLPGLVTLEKQMDLRTGEVGFRFIPIEAAQSKLPVGEASG